jgi:hypothetical protein
MVFEVRKEWESTDLFVSSEQGQFAKAISCLHTTVRKKKKGTSALLISRSSCFGGGGQAFEIKYSEEKS